MQRRYSVTRAEVQALPRFVVADADTDDDDDHRNSSPRFRRSPLGRRIPLPNVTDAIKRLAVEDEEFVEEEEEIIEEEEEYEEIIEEEIIIEEVPVAPSPHGTQRSTHAPLSPVAESAVPSPRGARALARDHKQESAATGREHDQDDEEEDEPDEEESLPDAEDVLEALKYILRQEKPVENGYITADQEQQMLALPLSEMVDIMKHFELCDNENAPIRWDLVCLMINAVEDEPDLSEEEEVLVDDDERDASGPMDDSDNGLEAVDEIASLGSGYDLEAKDDTCHSDLSELNESGIIAG